MDPDTRSVFAGSSNVSQVYGLLRKYRLLGKDFTFLVNVISALGFNNFACRNAGACWVGDGPASLPHILEPHFRPSTPPFPYPAFLIDSCILRIQFL